MSISGPNIEISVSERRDSLTFKISYTQVTKDETINYIVPIKLLVLHQLEN